jgi:hypothetical protein
MRAAVVPNRAASQDTHWKQWTLFCDEHDLSPDLLDQADPIPFLQVFAQRLRTGELAAGHKPVGARQVEDYLRTIGQTITSMGSSDPRLNPSGRLVSRLQQQLKGYSKADPGPVRVKPIPVSLLAHVVNAAYTTPDATLHAQADCAIIGFFFLCRPGEVTLSTASSDSTPFRLQDVEFHTGSVYVNAAYAPFSDLHAGHHSALLTFTNQKNARRNEKIAQGDTSSPLLSPTRALYRRVLHLRHHNAPPDTPLHTIFLKSGTTTNVTSANLTSLFRTSATALESSIGFGPRDFSIRSLRAGGAMALLCAQVDPLLIKLVGRWKSDEMLHYLHAQAAGLTHGLAAKMLVAGDFRLHPNQDIAPGAAPLLAPYAANS